MKTCLVQSRPDRAVGKHVPCGLPAEYKLKYAKFGPYPSHTAYMCAKHAEMATKLVKVEQNRD